MAISHRRIVGAQEAVSYSLRYPTFSSKTASFTFANEANSTCRFVSFRNPQFSADPPPSPLFAFSVVHL
uniref:Uncharacterized protein n=1 Tax=Caenorhabditis japonica TaxID=281687 RepID=A0A8R1IY37_CAEJA